jgi:hypothetical protein
MGGVVGTVSFIANFHWCLGFEGRACVNGLSGQVRFHCHSGISQCPSPLPRVNSTCRHRSFLCRPHVELQATYGTDEYRGAHRGSRPSLNRADCPRQSANRSGNSTTHAPSPHLAVRLTRPAHHLLPGTLMLGYTGLNYQQSKTQAKVEAMQSSSINAGFGVKAFSRSVASCTGLTVGSTRTKMLRIFAG